MSTLAQTLQVEVSVLTRAYRLMYTAAALADLYEKEKAVTSTYVHATARGHEAIQLALGMLLRPIDYVAPYYRDDALLLGMGITPYELMLQLLAKKDDPFSGGRTYYAHPSLKREDMPKIPHQSSATGMQAIPITGVAQGLRYLTQQGLLQGESAKGIAVCSIGDGAMTEGEVSEALQMAVLQRLPVMYLVQDNGWGISAQADEMYAQSAVEFAKGFAGLEVRELDGQDFVNCYEGIADVVEMMREERRPFLVHVPVPLLNHHTSGVRKEWYRDDLGAHQPQDPMPILRRNVVNLLGEQEVVRTEAEVTASVKAAYQEALAAADPEPADLYTHMFAPSPVVEEQGERSPAGNTEVVMVDAALHAVDRILTEFPEALLYGQDVGGQLGGVFREAATLADKHGAERVFNTPIQEGYIIGSTVGMSVVGCKPIVEIQFADYMWPGVNQLFAELSRSYYLSDGKWPVQSLIRVPCGAYGGGGPYHSSSIESAILTIKGVKVVYPSNAADMKGLLRSAFLDPNPVVFFEHKGLYWSKVPGSKAARTIEPSDDYVIPLGKARIFQAANDEKVAEGDSCLVITYGMGVHWALNASAAFPGQVEILDLRSLAPLDWEMIQARVEVHNKVMVLTEETIGNSFAESLSGRIASTCFEKLDAPVQIVGAQNLPAIPLNKTLEAEMLPSVEKITARLDTLLHW